MNIPVDTSPLLSKEQSSAVADKNHHDIDSIFDELEDQWKSLNAEIVKPSSEKKGAYLHKFEDLIAAVYPLLENSETLASLLNSPFAKLGRELLMENRELFYTLYRNSINNFEPPPHNSNICLPRSAMRHFDDSQFSISPRLIHRMVEEIKTTGMYVWKNFLANSHELDSLRASAKKTIGNTQGRIHQLLPRISKNHIKKDTYLEYDEELRCKHWFTIKDSPNDHLFIRIRSRYDFGIVPTIPSLNFIMHHPSIWTLAAAYFQSTPILEYLLCEELNPNPHYAHKSENPALAPSWFDLHDAWHVDSVYQRLKVFIFLTDVEPEHGPMRARPRSHAMVQAGWGNIVYNLFCQGRSGGYPTERQMQETNFLETQLITGKAGDAIIFDPHMLHSSTPCLKDHRLILAHSFIAKSPANSLFQHLSKDIII